MPLFETVTHLAAGSDLLRHRRYGVIEVADGMFCGVRLRPFPKIVSAADTLLLGKFAHRRRSGDRIRLFYNQPRRFPNFLVLKYAESACGTSMTTLTRAGGARRDCPAEAKQRPVVRRSQWQDHVQIVGPLGVGTALPVVVSPALHQAVLRRLSVAAAMDWHIGDCRLLASQRREDQPPDGQHHPHQNQAEEHHHGHKPTHDKVAFGVLPNNAPADDQHERR